ncbi:type II secretion system protein [Photobacterium leiognathi]|uniref:type II secretion system protein n=1 Tax=Photobacterium leiognathi TaxID=553611 RepID=UPI0027386FF6|nr:type II secretion system protein [Photobacterium leiognathi]
MKKNQQGFTLTELVLTFVVVGVILATTVPLLLSKVSMQQQQHDIDQAISLTLERLQEQVVNALKNAPFRTQLPSMSSVYPHKPCIPYLIFMSQSEPTAKASAMYRFLLS